MAVFFFVGLNQDVARLRSPNEDGRMDQDYGFEPGCGSAPLANRG